MDGTVRGAALATSVGVAAALFGCNYPKIQKCHEEMKASQAMMLELSNDRENAELADRTLGAVQATLAACRAAERTEEVEKITQAEREILAHKKALEERAAREKRPKLTEAELDALEKSGDTTCPKGQQYEHHQDKRLIDCKGPQLFEMGWAAAQEYFKRRGFIERAEGKKLQFERGAQVYDFFYASAGSSDKASCLSIVADPGIPWQETVTRATGVQPHKLSLSEPVKAKSGALALLVEGGPEQYTVKLGSCDPTPGQKRLEAEPAQK